MANVTVINRNVISSDMKQWKLGVTITKLDNSQWFNMKATGFETKHIFNSMLSRYENFFQKNYTQAVC